MMWQNWVSKLAPGLLLALLACTVTYGQEVPTNYMPGADFSKYHAYAWASDIQGLPAVGGDPDQILDAQVKQAIDLQMAAKGFTKVKDRGTADLLLGYQFAIDQEKQTNDSGDNLGGWGGWAGWGWGPWWGGFAKNSISTSSNYIGTFVVGMYDPALKKVVWIGTAQHAIEPSNKREKNQEQLNKGARKLLKDFPPGRDRR
jgi:Domain of unknown function (DUF4136)